MQSKLIRVLCVVLVCVFAMTLALGGAAYLTARADTSASAANASGQCGEDLFWSYDPVSGILTILGTGAMWDFDRPEDAPWASIASSIKTIAFSTGVTVIGRNAFAGCPVEEVQFPETLTEIKENAFSGCEKLAAVDLSATQVTTIEAGAFTGCPSLTTEAVVLPETATSVSEIAFDDVVAETTPAPAETVPAEPVVVPTEPVVIPTEPAVSPTEPAVTPTEPVVTPTEPTPTEPEPTEPEPTEPVEETKTYTTEDNVTVTETRVNGVLREKRSVSPSGSYTVSYYGEDGSAQNTDHYNASDTLTGVTRHETNESGVIVREEYTAQGNQPAGTAVSIVTVYTDEGVIAEQTTKMNVGYTSVRIYDEQGRDKSSVTYDQDGEVYSTSTYTHEGNTTTIVSEYVSGYKNVTVNTFGDDGRIVSSVGRDMDGNQVYETTYTYDEATGNVTQRTTGEGYASTYVHNADGNMISEEIVRDDGSRQVTEFDENGCPTVGKSYDADGTLTNEAKWIYGSEGLLATEYYDGNGKLTEKTTYQEDGNTFEVYDENGKVTSTRHYTYDEATGISTSVETSYDENGAVTGVSTDTYNRETGITVWEAVYSDGGKYSSMSDNDGNTLEERRTSVDENGSVTGFTCTVYDPGTGESTTTTTAVTTDAEGNLYIAVTQADGTVSDPQLVTQEELDEMIKITMPSASNEIMLTALEETIAVTEEVTEEEASVEKAPAGEVPVEETPAEETPAEEAPVVETPAEETPVVETPAEEAPVVETPAEEAPVAETPAVEVPAGEPIESTNQAA